MRLTVKYKLLLPILAAVIIGIAAIQYLTTMKSGDVLENEIFSGVENLSTASAERYDDWIGARKADVTNWSTLPMFAQALTGDPNAVSEVNDNLRGKVEVFTYYSGINLIGTDGIVKASAHESRYGLDLSSREYVKKALAGETSVSQPLVSKATGELVFTVTGPVYSASGTIVGALSGVVSMKSINERILGSIKIGETGYAVLIGTAGITIYHPNQDFVMKLDLTEYEFGREILQNKNGTIKYWFDAQSTWKGMAFHQMKNTGWIVAITAPLEEIMSELDTLTTYSLVGGSVTAILVALVILYFVTAIVRIIAAASKQMAELAKGDVSNDIPEKMQALNDELGDLSRSCQALINSQRERAAVARAIADGDLTGDVSAASEKDLLGNALKDMSNSLNEIMAGVNDAAQQVAAGSSEVSDSSQQLSQGATEQAASIEEINSSMTQLGSQTRANAEKATEANKLADESNKAAGEGNERMARMTQAMNDISESSQAIAKIIKVIDEIAFQTNLLALNAAVEAARAGRHGKGFAVVAEEVRNLAGRSAKAAEETTQLIESSVMKVAEGSEAAGLTAEMLERITQETTAVAELLQDIARASTEQAEGIAQVGDGLNQIDQVTQQNTASAEETASAAEELSAQSATLRQLLSRFRTKSQDKRSVTVRPSPPKALTGNKSQAKQEAKPQANSRPQGKDDWGQADERTRPESVISLDDDDFGKY